MDWTESSTLRITCARGLAPWLRQELSALGYAASPGTETGVEIEGSLQDACGLNLRLGTAFHLLYRLAEFPCDSGDELYAAVRDLPWETVLAQDGYLSVVSRVNHPSVVNSMWPNLKLKDAIVDRMQETTGARPDSGPNRDRAVVTLHWRGKKAAVYLDTSGMKLSDRGYRRIPHKAPLRESLAAGILMAAEYAGKRPLVNPMCGSGTLAIEAALMGSGRAPGLLRSNYGLCHLLGFDRPAWEELRAELRRESRGKKPAPILASDHDPEAIAAARKNAKTAGVDSLIEFKVCDFADTPVPEAEEGLVLINPEYGARMGEQRALEETYGRIGDFFKQRCQGYTGWVFTGNRGLLKKVGLRATRKVSFYNGEIECRLARYLLYKGKHKSQ